MRDGAPTIPTALIFTLSCRICSLCILRPPRVAAYFIDTRNLDRQGIRTNGRANSQGAGSRPYQRARPVDTSCAVPSHSVKMRWETFRTHEPCRATPLHGSWGRVALLPLRWGAPCWAAVPASISVSLFICSLSSFI